MKKYFKYLTHKANVSSILLFIFILGTMVHFLLTLILILIKPEFWFTEIYWSYVTGMLPITLLVSIWLTIVIKLNR